MNNNFGKPRVGRLEQREKSNFNERTRGLYSLLLRMVNESQYPKNNPKYQEYINLFLSPGTAQDYPLQLREVRSQLLRPLIHTALYTESLFLIAKIVDEIAIDLNKNNINPQLLTNIDYTLLKRLCSAKDSDFLLRVLNGFESGGLKNIAPELPDYMIVEHWDCLVFLCCYSAKKHIEGLGTNTLVRKFHQKTAQGNILVAHVEPIVAKIISVLKG